MDVKKGYMKVGDDTVLPITSYDCIIDKDGNKLTESAESIAQNTKAVANIQDYIGIDITKKRNLCHILGNGTISQTDGSTISASDTVSYSDYIRTSTVTISFPSVSAVRVFKYGTDRAFLSTEALGGSSSYTVTHNGYIRVQFVSSIAWCMVTEGSSPSPYVPYVPTLREGTIVAYGGSDSTGYYVRFANGVQMCWLNKELGSVAVTNASANGSLFVSSEFTGATYPMPFVSTPVAIAHGMSGYNCFSTNTTSSSVTKWQNIFFCRSSSATLPNARVSYYAIGRWK